MRGGRGCSTGRKWHYFRDGRSLCKRFMLLGRGEFESGNEASPDNCAACRRVRAGELLAASADVHP